MLRARTTLLTAAALAGFAANSLLTRSALGTGQLDAASFTLVRLATGAATLAVLASARTRPTTDRGSTLQAAALAGYAVLFTLAYARIGAGIGALILFGSVQVTMIGAGIGRGERPRIVDWIGMVVAVAGLVVLTRPGATAPDAIGALLMAAAGACWGGYSLAGRRSRDPLGATTGNFLRAALVGAGVFAIAAGRHGLHFTVHGVWLATASGSIASGLGYTLWYAALPSLAAWRAAVVQLTVPVVTALAATAWLGEAITPRLTIATIAIAAGVGLTSWPSAKPAIS